MPPAARLDRRQGSWLAMRSVRARITIMASLVVAATLVSGGAILLTTLEHSLTRDRDDLSRARAADLGRQAADGTLRHVITDVGDNSVGQVVDSSGKVLAATPGLTGRRPISGLLPLNSKPEVVLLHHVPDGSETETYRVWALTAPTDSGNVTVFVGASPESTTEAVTTLRRSLVLGIPVVLLLLAASTRLLVGRALKPVEVIRSEVAAISDAADDRRVPVPEGADEISRLAQTMNAMLDRLEASGKRQRDFVGDASHELQSPLTSLRAQLEVALAHPDVVNWPALAADLLADGDRLERLVRDLLFLARQDSSGGQHKEHAATAGELFDLDDVVLEEVARLRLCSRVEIMTSGVSAAPVRGGREELARLVRNLLENAARHAGSRVVVELSQSCTQTTLAICDDGTGIPAVDRERVFERFTRLDDARTRGQGGTGLGLSIAKAIVERHHGTIRLEETSSPPVGASGGPGVLVLIQLPVAPTSGAVKRALE
jgi:signal transduction histidine kinase